MLLDLWLLSLLHLFPYKICRLLCMHQFLKMPWCVTSLAVRRLKSPIWWGDCWYVLWTQWIVHRSDIWVFIKVHLKFMGLVSNFDWQCKVTQTILVLFRRHYICHIWTALTISVISASERGLGGFMHCWLLGSGLKPQTVCEQPQVSNDMDIFSLVMGVYLFQR